MTSFLRKNNILLLLATMIFLGFLLRFYDLPWGAPFFFHPDERNIASSISQLHFPDGLNPHFFAYGSLPIYTVFFLGLAYNFFTSCHFSLVTCHVPFEQAILLLRFFSALFSVALLPLFFILGKKLHNEVTGLVAAFLGATSVGLIQYAHFGTFELWLTFLSTLLFLSHVLLWQTKKKRFVVFNAVFFGLLVATKISSLVLFPLLFLIPTLLHEQPLFKKLSSFSIHVLLSSAIASGIYLLINPYSLLDLTSFYNSLSYESAVATGSMMVFYTGEFVNTIPIIYHLTHIYSFLLNPLLFFLFLPALVYTTFKAVTSHNIFLRLLLVYFLLLFLSQAFLFVKWTRYLIPTLPFVYLMIAFSLTDLFSRLNKKLSSALCLSSLFLGSLICLLFAFAFFATVYVQPDTRVQASAWAQQHLPHNAIILSEVYDLGVVPFSSYFGNITLFNFYDLDNHSPQYNSATLKQALSQSDYLLLPSQRLVKSRLLRSSAFPVSSPFYSSLLQEKTSFKEIYRTPCDLWCTITYWGDPVFNFEGTSNIFDRPTLFLFQKQ